MARNNLLCADVPLRNYSLTHYCIKHTSESEQSGNIKVVIIHSNFHFTRLPSLNSGNNNNKYVTK